MNVIVFGASGAIGRAIATELVERGHTVTGVSRRGDPSAAGVNVVKGDASSADQVAKVTAGYDAVVSATGPRKDETDDPAEQVHVARALVEGVRSSGLERLVVVGGAGSLEVGPGQQLPAQLLMNSPTFPDAHKPVARGAAEALAYYRSVDDVDWTYVSPAALIEPGKATGTFRVGGDQLLADNEGNSRISIDDFAIAVVDELEGGQALRRRITVAY